MTRKTMHAQLPAQTRLRETEQAGFRQLWPVYERYEIEEGNLTSKGSVARYYSPAIEPHLVSEFAKVHDPKALLSFAKRFGELSGNGTLVEPAIRHARRIAAAAEVIEKINGLKREFSRVMDSPRVVEGLRRFLKIRLQQIGIVLLSPEEFTADPGWLMRRGWIMTHDWHENPFRAAHLALAKHLFNPNLEGLRYRMVEEEKEEPQGPLPGLYLHFNNLLDVIYWRLATQMRGEWRRCEWRKCRRVFPVHDPREIFCSSRCRNNDKQTRKRERKREKKKAKRRRRK